MNREKGTAGIAGCPFLDEDAVFGNTENVYKKLEDSQGIVVTFGLEKFPRSAILSYVSGNGTDCEFRR